MTAVVAEALRTCTDCGRQAFTEADLEGFKKSARCKHGRENRCRPCHSARTRGWRATNTDRVREYYQAYYAANRERISEYRREYRSGAFRDRLVWDVRELSYPRVHQRLRAHFGRASEYTCVRCDGPAREWAFTNDDPDPRYDVVDGYTVPYSLLPEYYQPMCSGCHRAFDAEHRERNDRR